MLRGMRRFAPFIVCVIVAVALIAVPWHDHSRAFAQSGVGGGLAAPILDPCASPNIAKSSVPINITTATTTSLVAVSGSTTVYACGFIATTGSTVAANTIQFEYGTGAACTSPTVLTGALNTAGLLTGPITYGGTGETIFKSAASAGICAVTTVGTGPSIQGVLTYVQQ